MSPAQSPAIPRGQGGTELALIGVGGLVEVDVQLHGVRERLHIAHERCRLGRRTGLAERAIGVDGLQVPAVDALVGPGADAGHHHQVHPPLVVLGVAVEELQRAVDAACLVAMDAAGDEHRGPPGWGFRLPRA